VAGAGVAPGSDTPLVRDRIPVGKGMVAFRRRHLLGLPGVKKDFLICHWVASARPQCDGMSPIT
jgi:hypothetical protein